MNMLVSICCTAFNHEKYIKQALDSFLMQKANFEFEIIVHDDASTDKTREIIEEYEKRYPDIIKPIYQSINQYSKKVNIFSEIIWPKAKGKYIALCEGDDYWTNPLKLQKQVDYMEMNPNCTLCFHNAIIIEHETVITDKKLINNIRDNNIFNTGEMAILGFIPTASQFFRKTSIDNLPEWYNKAIIGDYPLQIITASHGYAYYINETLSAYRMGVQGSASYKYSKKSIDKKIEYNNAFISIIDSLDEYTKYKYTELFNKAKLQWEFQVLVLEKNIKQFKKEKYALYYNSLGTIGKIKLNFRCYFPNMFDKLISIKRYMNEN